MNKFPKLMIHFTLMLFFMPGHAVLADDYHSHHYYTQPYRYCDFRVSLSNASNQLIRVNEGWIWPFTSHQILEPYGNYTKCMIFGHISSLSFEYFDKNDGLFHLIPGCPKHFYAQYSVKVKIKNRKALNSDIPYCELI